MTKTKIIEHKNFLSVLKVLKDVLHVLLLIRKNAVFFTNVLAILYM